MSYGLKVRQPGKGFFTWPSEPYKGLNYYTGMDAPLFTEREDEVADCAVILGEYSTRLLLLHGRTGAGKSSFLRAGLVPKLEGQASRFYFLRESGNHIDPIFVRCTDDPVSRLQQALRRAYYGDPVLASVGDDCRRRMADALWPGFIQNKKELADSVLEAISAVSSMLPQTLVLVIDQCEEIFTLQNLAEPQNRRNAFVYFLEECCLRNFDVKVVLALRTEYYGQFCDSFRVNPTLRITSSPRVGFEQFMLLGLHDKKSIVSVILRPTSDEGIGPYGAPKDIYEFSYAPGVADKIAEDLLMTYGESSILPVLQIVCKDLYKRARLEGGDCLITITKYHNLGGVGGSLDGYIDEALKEVLSNTGDGIADSQQITKWRRVLSMLVARHEGGAITSIIEDEKELISISKHEGITGDHQKVLEALSDDQWRLLRQIVTFDEGNEQDGDHRSCIETRRDYSLGHDAIAIALYHWSEAEAKVERERTLLEEQAAIERKKIEEKSAEELKRVERRNSEEMERAKRQFEALKWTTVWVGAVLALLLLTVFWQATAKRNEFVRRAVSISQADQTPDFRRRILLLLTSLSRADGVWKMLVSSGQTTERLRSILLNSPVSGGTFEAIGLSKDGRRLAFLDKNGTMKVQVMGERDSVIVGQLPSDMLSTSIRWHSPAVGFVNGFDKPVAVANGRFAFWSEGQYSSVLLDQIIPSWENEQSRPFIEIAAGGIRVSYWLRSNGADDEYRIYVVRPQLASDGSIKPAGIIRPIIIPITAGSSWPALAARSDLAAVIARSSRGSAAQRQLEIIDLQSGRLDGPLVFDSDGPRRDGATEIDPPRLLAIAEDGRGILVRRERGMLDMLRYEGGVISPASNIELPENLQEFWRPRGFSTSLVGAAVKLSDRAKAWNFAWLSPSRVVHISVEDERIVYTRELLSGLEGGTKISYSDDGKYIVLIDRGWASESHYRVWNLSKDREVEVNSILGSGVYEDIFHESCEIARIAGDPTFSKLERAIWVGDDPTDPCLSYKRQGRQ
ncbi:hypothetical protein [Azospirillum soli]|uniref:nSTAND1 domain-containing NTPase n=1 Tax=Azospirillum soli TaxID=1304799 RepID=UPI001AE4DBD5|nr:hypothetical protein [Azospirillum soli]MBP2316819.1 hypothetical protein [Azospirillum soli]